MSDDDNKNRLNCLICGSEVSANCSYSIFYTVIRHSGTLLAKSIQKIVRRNVERSSLPSTFVCIKCFNIFEDLDYSEVKCSALRKSILSSFNKNCSKNALYLEEVNGVACQTDENFVLRDNNIDKGPVQSSEVHEPVIESSEKRTCETEIITDVQEEPGGEIERKSTTHSIRRRRGRIPKRNILNQKKQETSEEKSQSSSKGFRLKTRDVRRIRRYIHPCSLCGRLFRRPCEVKQHLLSHGGAKPYQCKDCGKRFGSKSGASIHALKKHGKDITAENIIEVHVEDEVDETLSAEGIDDMVEKSIRVKREDENNSDTSESSDDDFEWKMDEDEIFGTFDETEVKCEPSTEESLHDDSSVVGDKDTSGSSDVKNENSISVNTLCIAAEETSKSDVNNEKKTVPPIKLITNHTNRKEEKTRKEKKKRKKDPVPKPPKHECPICGKMWRTMSEFKSHVATHSHERPYICEICGQAYKHKGALDIHVGMHNGINPFCCPFCNKAFTQKGALQRHLPIHTGEAPFQCELCGKRFVHHTSFNMHTLAHTGQKSYKCSVCGLALLSGSHLKRHSRVHTGERPYQCQTCGKRFAERYNLVAHTRVHDPAGSNNKDSSKKMHRCQLCGAAFDRKPKLEDHLALSHNKMSEGDDTRKWVGHLFPNDLNHHIHHHSHNMGGNIHLTSGNVPHQSMQSTNPGQEHSRNPVLVPTHMTQHDLKSVLASVSTSSSHQGITSIPSAPGQHQQNWPQVMFGSKVLDGEVIDSQSVVDGSLSKMNSLSTSLGNQHHRILSEMSALGGMNSGHTMSRNMLTSCLAGSHPLIGSNHSHHIPNHHSLQPARINMFSSDNNH